MKKVISLILCVLMLGSCMAFADAIEGSRTVIGADLDADDIAYVYKEFGISRGDVKELTVTNAEEREYLKGLVDESLIGTKSISCVYIEALDEGKGLDVQEHHLVHPGYVHERNGDRRHYRRKCQDRCAL